MTASVTMRCGICGRFRAYRPDDRHCIGCGHDALETSCTCGREYDYALAESGEFHCPRCGKVVSGRAEEFE